MSLYYHGIIENTININSRVQRESKHALKNKPQKKFQEFEQEFTLKTEKNI